MVLLKKRKWLTILLFASLLSNSVCAQEEFTIEDVLVLEEQQDYYYTFDYDSCLIVSLQLMQIHKQTDAFKDRYVIHLLKYAEALKINALFELSLKNHLEVLKLVTDKGLKSDVLHNIGLLYDEIGDYEQANYYYHKSLKLEDSSNRKAATYNALGDNYLYLNKLDSAYLFYQKSIHIFDSLQNLEELALLHYSAIETYIKLGKNEDVEKVTAYFDLSESESFETYTKGYELYAKGFYQEYLGNYDSSLYYFQKTIDIAENLGYIKGIKVVCQSAIDLAVKYEKYQTAFHFLTLKDSIENLILSEREIGFIKEHEIAYETYIKEKEIEIANIKIEGKERTLRLTYILLSLLAFILLGVIFFARRLRKLNQVLNRKSEQISFLYKELNHRVKNNLQLLASIIGLQVFESEQEEAISNLNSLRSRVLSMSLIHDKINAIEDNIEFHDYVADLFQFLLKSYAHQQVIFNNEVEDLLIKTSKMSLLSLILNEVFTNFLKYGITNPRPEITVKTTLLEHELKLVIQDNGITPSDKPTKENLGSKIIRTLTRQLNARLKLSTDAGYKYEFFIPYTPEFSVEKRKK